MGTRYYFFFTCPLSAAVSQTPRFKTIRYVVQMGFLGLATSLLCESQNERAFISLGKNGVILTFSRVSMYTITFWHAPCDVVCDSQ